MQYWLYLNDMEESQLVEIARKAESVGFKGVAVADHIAVPVEFDTTAHPSGQAPFDYRTSFPDPLITAATVLAATTRLEVMSYVYVLPMREPFSVAKQVSTLSRLSEGRFRFGVGAGWMLEEIELIGHPTARRGRRMDEMLDIMRGFWTEESLAFSGEFFDFANAGMAPRPTEPISVWVGGKSRAALERAVRHQGWLGMNYGLEEIDGLLAVLAEERAKAPPAADFKVFVIPNAEPSPELYADLEAKGVTDTMGFAFPTDDPAFASLEAKQQALEHFSSVYL